MTIDQEEGTARGVDWPLTCLTVGREVRLDTIAVGETSSRVFGITNHCSEPVEIESIETRTDSSAFDVDPPELPVTLPEDWDPLITDVLFTPGRSGATYQELIVIRAGGDLVLEPVLAVGSSPEE